MKHLMLLAVLLLFCGCGGDRPEADAYASAPEGFTEGFDRAVDSYLALKDDLVKADYDAASAHSVDLTSALETVPGSGLDEQGALQWAQLRGALIGHAKNVSAQSDVYEMRDHFLPLSESFINAVKIFGPPSETLYVQHCPMAFDNTGGDWLSRSDQIYNPYYGNMMLHCGYVADTLER